MGGSLVWMQTSIYRMEDRIEEKLVSVDKKIGDLERDMIIIKTVLQLATCQKSSLC